MTNISKKTISEIFNISEVTITKISKKINRYEKILVNDELTDLIVKKKNEKKNNNNNEHINNDSNDIANITDNLNKIFIMPHNYDSDGLLSGKISLSTILNSESNSFSTCSSSDTCSNNSDNVHVKRKRGRPRKNL